MAALLELLNAAGHRGDRVLCAAEASVNLAGLVRGSSLGGRRDELRGRSVLIATKGQLLAALALIELDAIARRLVLCPPAMPAEHISSVISKAAVDAVVRDQAGPEPAVSDVGCTVTCSSTITPAAPRQRGDCKTEWILLTSGTTGEPKLVVHTLSSLVAPIKMGSGLGDPPVWSTFYDIRRYGGLQIFLRAVLGGGSMVLSSAEESPGDFLTRAGACGMTHISGTPSHWRRALISPQSRAIAPRYVRLSGEVADQAILDHLRAVYPQAGIAHAFASTEAGVAFEVGDGLSGFPASLIGEPGAKVEMKVEDGSLRIRSSRTAVGYLGDESTTFVDRDGFVDTGDSVERRGDRFYFVGRADGVINVGGVKVHPEEVEAVINRQPGVRMALVKARRNPIVGAVVVADIVATHTADATRETEALKSQILEACRSALAPHKVPASIRFVPSLVIAPSGKLARGYA